jgi:hypothetical protein
MKRSISPETYEALRGLLRQRSPLRLLTGKNPTLASILEQVELAAEPAAALYLLPLLSSGDRNRSEKVAHVLGKLVRSVPVIDLPWLDEFARNGQPSWEISWRKLTPSDVSKLHAPKDDLVFALGVASFHPSGFIRQAAVEQLCASNSGSVLLFLLIRLNDWVENVRRVAQSCVEARLQPEHLGSFVDALPLILKLRVAGRVDHGPLLHRIRSFLTTEAGIKALEAALDAQDQLVRRFAYRLIAESPHTHLPSILDRAFRDSDPIIRRWAAEQIEHTGDRDRQRPLLVRAMSDRIGRIRADGLGRFAVLFPDEAREHMMGALLDRAPAVRSAAQVWARRSANIELVAFYQDHLHGDSPTQIRAAIAGLGETGTAADISQLLPFLKDERVAVRRAALGGVGRYTSNYTPSVTEALLDESPAVSRLAFHVLADNIPLIDVETLWHQFSEQHPYHVRRNILALLNHLPKWERIVYLLRATGDSDPQIAALAFEEVRRWMARFNTSFVMPSKTQLQRVQDELVQHRFVLDREIFRQLEFFTNGSTFG